jgi:hypothetical protein
MQMYVQWDHENETIIFGPQGVKGEGDNWYPYNDDGEIQNPRTQSRRYIYIEAVEAVIGIVEGSPDQTWLQSRQAGYGGLEDQLDRLWHDINAGSLDKTGAFYTFIKEVKDANPKPE